MMYDNIKIKEENCRNKQMTLYFMRICAVLINV